MRAIESRLAIGQAANDQPGARDIVCRTEPIGANDATATALADLILAAGMAARATVGGIDLRVVAGVAAAGEALGTALPAGSTLATEVGAYLPGGAVGIRAAIAGPARSAATEPAAAALPVVLAGDACIAAADGSRIRALRIRAAGPGPALPVAADSVRAALDIAGACLAVTIDADRGRVLALERVAAVSLETAIVAADVAIAALIRLPAFSAEVELAMRLCRRALGVGAAVALRTRSLATDFQVAAGLVLAAHPRQAGAVAADPPRLALGGGLAGDTRMVDADWRRVGAVGIGAAGPRPAPARATDLVRAALRVVGARRAEPGDADRLVRVGALGVGATLAAEDARAAAAEPALR